MRDHVAVSCQSQSDYILAQCLHTVAVVTLKQLKESAPACSLWSEHKMETLTSGCLSEPASCFDTSTCEEPHAWALNKHAKSRVIEYCSTRLHLPT